MNTKCSACGFAGPHIEKLRNWICGKCRKVLDLYDVAKDVAHQHGYPWTDPRTGETFPPPKGD